MEPGFHKPGNSGGSGNKSDVNVMLQWSRAFISPETRIDAKLNSFCHRSFNGAGLS